MSKKNDDDLGETATIEPLHFYKPEKQLNPSRVGSCFCCSHRLEKVYIEAVCVEDNKPRRMHVVCWQSNRDDKPGIYRRLEAMNEADREWKGKQQARHPD